MSWSEWLQLPRLSTWFPSGFMGNSDTQLWNVSFYFAVVAYKKVRMILPLRTHWMVQWKPQAAGVLSATKLCWNSNPLCVAICCNINFINITANTFMGLCKSERKCKCYQTFHPFFNIYFYLFCHKFCADAGVTGEYKAKELSELRSFFYV